MRKTRHGPDRKEHDSSHARFETGEARVSVALAERLRAAGMPFKAIVIAMRKLLSIINVTLKENLPWNPELQKA